MSCVSQRDERPFNPTFFDTRDTPFARADRIAWNEEQSDFHPRIVPMVERLQSVLKPLDLPNQVIHADMTENVLFAADLLPAVIDFSPYWRPAAYAQAIVVVGALDWCGAGELILQWVDDIPEIHQLMIRAELFRLAVLDELAKQGQDTLGAVSGHLDTIAMLENGIRRNTEM